MSAFEPGTVAVATVRGVPNVRVWHYDSGRLKWLTPEPVKGSRIHNATDVTDVRPLVVLDPDDTETLDRLVTLFHESWSGCEGARDIGLAGALRSLTKPPRIPEPGLWGVVHVPTGIDWVRTGPTQRSPHEWRCAETGATADWDELVDPVLVRDGIEDAS